MPVHNADQCSVERRANSGSQNAVTAEGIAFVSGSQGNRAAHAVHHSCWGAGKDTHIRIAASCSSQSKRGGRASTMCKP